MAQTRRPASLVSLTASSTNSRAVGPRLLPFMRAIGYSSLFILGRFNHCRGLSAQGFLSQNEVK